MLNNDSGRIRVLQLASPTGLYGAERWILALIKHLDPSKIETFVAAIRDEPGLEAPICNEAGRHGFNNHVFEFYGRLNFAAVRELRRFIIKKRIDIIHTHGYKTDFVGLLAVRGIKCKIVSTPHGWTQQPDLKLKCYELLDRMIFPFFDVVVPLSEGIFRGLASLPFMKNRLALIENGVDMSEAAAVHETAAEVLSLKEKGGLVLGYVGRLTAGKGLDVLLRAVAEYGESLWQVVIVGEGEERSGLEALAGKLGIGNRVHFFGFRPDRLSFLKGFDMFVLPSRSEGTPRCVMEAMACEIPVMVSDIPGCRLLVTDRETGILFTVDDPAGIAEAVRDMAKDGLLRERLVVNAKKLLEEKFSAARMAREYTTLFLQLMGKEGCYIECHSQTRKA